MNESGNWLPSADLNTLRERAVILRRLRGFFDERGFFEVQTPCLSRDVVVDRYIDPIEVAVTLPGGEETFWLQTSPEFAMKRLLAAGATSIYQIGPVFRGGEAGARHNIEFTMLEWYRVGDDYQAGMDLLDEFARSLLLTPPATRIEWEEAFRAAAGIDPFGERMDSHEINRLMADKVEPWLAGFESVIVYDWPADHSALARTRAKACGRVVAERFELYVRGIELANGYHELLDAGELAGRNRMVNELRRQDGKPILPEESRMLAAMRHGLPASAGVAVGVDRLVMILTGKQAIREVLAFDTRSI
jgi:elongation factor P--(R)-beta-lysine ligase